MLRQSDFLHGRDSPPKEGMWGRSFADNLFGQCYVCEIDEHLPRSGFDRLRSAWNVEVCMVESRHSGVIDPDVEGGMDSDSGSESDYTPAMEVKSQPARGAATMSPESETALQQAISGAMWSCGDVFVSRGWALELCSGERYKVLGRTVKLSLLPATERPPDFRHNESAVGEAAEKCSRIMVHDGSLRQPLMDYLLQNGKNESYDHRGTENPAAVTGAGKYLDFNVAPTDDRLTSMNLATLQAQARRMCGSGSGSLARSSLSSPSPSSGQLGLGTPVRVTASR